MSALLFVFHTTLFAAEATPRPNILWIIAEDMGPDLTCYGRSDLKTPHLDRLAAQGCRYTRAFSTAPICSCARSALMTGVYQTAFGADNHRSNRQPGASGLPSTVLLLTSRFRQAGYFTANVTRLPESLGFSGKGKTDFNFATPRKPFDSSDWDDLKGHQPFFAQINLEEAHRIYHKCEIDPVDPAAVVLPPYLADDPLVREDWAAYLDTIQTLDAKVGAILALLESAGLADNTVVMFMGDNGREDFRGKYHLYEQGSSIPLIVRALGHASPDSVSDDLVSGIDISATSLDLAGIPMPGNSDAVSFLGSHRKQRRYVYTALGRVDENLDRVRAVRDARWKYLRNYDISTPYLQDSGYRSTTNPTYLAMRKLHALRRLNADQEKFFAQTRPPEELYDLDADPFELHNLAASPSHVGELKRLRGALDDWMHRTGDDMNIPEDPASLDYALKSYEASRPRALPRNLQELRANYQNLSEVEPILGSDARNANPGE
ncbi:MAG TPA: sulfatase [Pirellulales bacterium]|nr:sulfatase [Pirellulales bacterium]